MSAQTGSPTGRQAGSQPYQYVALRCVPRVDREEFLNVGVVLYCQAEEFLQATWHVDRARLTTLAPGLDLDRVCASLAFVDGVCAGSPHVGQVGLAPISQRFGYLKAPRSTVLQPGPVHGGVASDCGRQLDRLLRDLVG